jgi:integrase
MGETGRTGPGEAVPKVHPLQVGQERRQTAAEGSTKVSVYKRGDVWWYKFRFAGQMIRESSKSESKTVAKDAERSRRRELEESYNQIKRRTLPPTFERAGSDWLDAEKPHLAERTYEIYEVAFRCHLKPVLGSLLLCDIDASKVASYQAKRKAEKASARTLNKELQVLRQVLKRHKLWANLQGDVKFEREHNDVGKALTREEEKNLLDASGSNALLKAVVTLALNTALRKSEIRMLRWNQIDFQKRTVTVGRAKSQAGTGRLIPLNQPAFEALAQWAGRLVEAKPDDFVFPACEAAGIEREHPDKQRIDPSKPITSWRFAWRAAIKRAKLKIRFHDLRHTCITKLAESQASEHTLMAIAGHVSRKMIEHYSHIRMEAKRAALDAIAKPVSEAGVAQNWAQSPSEEKPPVRN